MITTVNYHLTDNCNFKCRYCFARYKDVQRPYLDKKEKIDLISKLAESNHFQKINFAGGEPTLDRDLPLLIKHAHNLGLETSVITNGSIIDRKWIQSVSGDLDMIGVSLDSFNKESNLELGCCCKQKTVNKEKIMEIAESCNTLGINLKINTVVTNINKKEVMKYDIAQINPTRWKILQATEVEGQNNTPDFKSLKVSNQDFSTFVTNNTIDSNIKIVPEKSEDIKGSYLMIDYSGRFYDGSQGKHYYSHPILTVGVNTALSEISVSDIKFEKRGGRYHINNQ